MSRPASESLGPFVATKRARRLSSHPDSGERFLAGVVPSSTPTNVPLLTTSLGAPDLPCMTHTLTLGTATAEETPVQRRASHEYAPLSRTLFLEYNKCILPHLENATVDNAAPHNQSLLPCDPQPLASARKHRRHNTPKRSRVMAAADRATTNLAAACLPASAIPLPMHLHAPTEVSSMPTRFDPMFDAMAVQTAAAVAPSSAHCLHTPASFPGIPSATLAPKCHAAQYPYPSAYAYPPHQQHLPYLHSGDRTYSFPTMDDAEGHLVYSLGDGLLKTQDLPQGRYKILSDLGEGTFGKVVECWDRRCAIRVAIKIVRSVPKYRDAARLEIDVLDHLRATDPEGWHHCVRLLDWFDYMAHVCIVFEKLGPSLYDQLRQNRFRPFSLEVVREFAYQLLESVSFVHSLTLVHTDLKPENILLADPNAKVEPDRRRSTKNSRSPNRRSSSGGKAARASEHLASLPVKQLHSEIPQTSIKLIDFGSATFESNHHSAVISTRHYRAPEVILGLGWTYPCDLWSVGCILVELYTGQALFQTHENLEHLAMMHVVLGPIPKSMIERADVYSQKYFVPVIPSSIGQPHPSDRPPSGSARRRRDTRCSKIAGGVQKRDRAASSTKKAGLSARMFQHHESTMEGHLDMDRLMPMHPGTVSVPSTPTVTAFSVVDSMNAGYVGDSSLSSQQLNWPAGAASTASVRAVRRVKSLADIVKCSDKHPDFVDLLRRLLTFEPRQRCTASEALRHPFFQEIPTDTDFYYGRTAATPTASSGGESSVCVSQATGLGRPGGCDAIISTNVAHMSHSDPSCGISRIPQTFRDQFQLGADSVPLIYIPESRIPVPLDVNLKEDEFITPNTMVQKDKILDPSDDQYNVGNASSFNTERLIPSNSVYEIAQLIHSYPPKVSNAEIVGPPVNGENSSVGVFDDSSHGTKKAILRVVPTLYNDCRHVVRSGVSVLQSAEESGRDVNMVQDHSVGWNFRPGGVATDFVSQAVGVVSGTYREVVGTVGPLHNPFLSNDIQPEDGFLKPGAEELSDVTYGPSYVTPDGGVYYSRYMPHPSRNDRKTEDSPSDVCGCVRVVNNSKESHVKSRVPS